MKAHRYQITTYEGIMDWTHRMGQTQDRLYIPGQGVLAYRGNEQIDFFSDDTEVIAEAEQAIKGTLDIEGGAKYLGEIELPDDAVSRVVSTGRALSQAKTAFQESARTLVDLL